MAEYLTLSLSSGGDVKIKLRPDLAPGHVERIVELANEGFYDGVKFHRVIPGFMAQGGCPDGTGMGVAWAVLGGAVVYGALKATVGLKLSAEEEYDGADLSIHKISATPDREVSW